MVSAVDKACMNLSLDKKKYVELDKPIGQKSFKNLAYHSGTHSIQEQVSYCTNSFDTFCLQVVKAALFNPA